MSRAKPALTKCVLTDKLGDNRQDIAFKLLIYTLVIYVLKTQLGNSACTLFIAFNTNNNNFSLDFDIIDIILFCQVTSVCCNSIQQNLRGAESLILLFG